jgi:hypothetical protein
MAGRERRPVRGRPQGSFLRRNGLSLVVAILFLAFMAGQGLTGTRQYNMDRIAHGETPVTLAAYLTSGHFLEAIGENWESEFLQMAAYVLLTAWLFQQGSSESKQPGVPEEVDRDPREARGQRREEAPWPVRRGGWMLKIYENSLALAFLALFLISFALHAVGGMRAYNEEARVLGDASITLADYLASSRFWFESFQNWQSEFLALVAMIVLSIWLRQRGSPESKPVDAPHSHTGS